MHSQESLLLSSPPANKNEIVLTPRGKKHDYLERQTMIFILTISYLSACPFSAVIFFVSLS